MRRHLGLVALAVLLACGASAQNAKRIDSLSLAERNDLRDAFFRLVLAKDPDVVALSRIEAMLQPDESKRLTFVVDEEIADPAQGGHRRSVLAYEGSHDGFPLKANVMLSVGFTSASFPNEPALIEAWGWDRERGRYNYYSLEMITPQTKRWFFHGSSDDLDKAEFDRGRCLSCHRSGAPLMKELLFPWNNWHSPIGFRANYLAGDADSWPVAADPMIDGRLTGAEKLETDFILPSLRRFNQARVERDRRVDADGKDLVVNARRVLRPLFIPTEFNLATARERSGMHPLGPAMTGQPSQEIRPPASFFLNHQLIAGQQVGLDGLGIGAANRFLSEAEFSVTPAEYEKLVNDSQQRLGNLGGDAVFAWLTPESAFVDNHLIDQLMHEGIVPRHFVAAVLAVELEEPLFSACRAQLLELIPDSFRFKRGEAENGREHELTERTIATLEAAPPDPGTANGLFLERLRSDDAVAELKADVEAYAARMKALLADPQTRSATLKRMHDVLLARRRNVTQDTGLRIIVESDKLLPISPRISDSRPSLANGSLDCG